MVRPADANRRVTRTDHKPQFIEKITQAPTKSLISDRASVTDWDGSTMMAGAADALEE